MIRQCVHIAALLLCAWDIYVYCQNETVLPLAAVVILLVSFFLRIGSLQKRFMLFDQIPLFAVIIISLITGYFFRSNFPLPEEAISPYPELTAAAQSGTIIMALLIWLRPLTQDRIYFLTFMAWLTVTLSINVPFTYPLFFKFSLFCLLSIIVVILHTSRRPAEKKYIFTYYRDFIVFSVILVGITVTLFFGISRSVVALDNAFMLAMRDYIHSRHYSHFLNISPQLSLLSPGYSAFDRRPVLEVTIPGVRAAYLKTQVFKDFDNGVWEEVKDPALYAVSPQLNPRDTLITLTMFTPFKNIVPSPTGVMAVEGPGKYQKDENQIIYGEEDRYTRVLKFSAREKMFPVQLTPEEIEEYRHVPPDIASKLEELSNEIIGQETDRAKKIERVRDYLKDGFQYSLEVNFRADNEGLISMIEYKRPAYCTYFATAMSLLLRAQGIPTRVVTGFFTQEVIDNRKGTMLVRVRDAHAWVEVLSKAEDPQTSQTFLTWAGFDPTPSAVASGSGKGPRFDFDRFAENVGLALMRFAAHVQNIDKDKAKLYMLYVLLMTLVLMNAKTILRALKSLWAPKTKAIKMIQPPARLHLVYKRYELFLKESFGEARGSTETDQEVVSRLKQRPEIPREAIEKVETFLTRYRAARFGEKKEEDLEGLLLN